MAEVMVRGQVVRDVALLISDPPMPVGALCTPRMGRTAGPIGVIGDDAVAEWLNGLAWAEGEVVLPLIDTTTVDTIGAGDGLTAGLAVGCLRPAMRSRPAGTAAASLVVEHLGGRPDFDDRLFAIECAAAGIRQQAERLGTGFAGSPFSTVYGGAEDA